MPWPFSRNVRPGWVPAGIVRRTRPFSVAHGDLGAEERLAEGDRDLPGEIGTDAGV